MAIGELAAFALHPSGLTSPSLPYPCASKSWNNLSAFQLFDRSGYRPRLTSEGRDILKLAQRTIALTREIQTVARNRVAVEGKIRLGAADTFALVCLPPLLTRLEVRAPALQVALDIDYSVNLDTKLHHGDLDIAFLTSPSGGPNVLLERLVPIELVWVASPRFGLDPVRSRPPICHQCPL